MYFVSRGRFGAQTCEQTRLVSTYLPQLISSPNPSWDIVITSLHGENLNVPQRVRHSEGSHLKKQFPWNPGVSKYENMQDFR